MLMRLALLAIVETLLANQQTGISTILCMRADDAFFSSSEVDFLLSSKACSKRALSLSQPMPTNSPAKFVYIDRQTKLGGH